MGFHYSHGKHNCSDSASKVSASITSMSNSKRVEVTNFSREEDLILHKQVLGLINMTKISTRSPEEEVQALKKEKLLDWIKLQQDFFPTRHPIELASRSIQLNRLAHQ